MKVEIIASTSERLLEALNANSLKQADLVKMTGIDKSSISLYFSGKVVPKGDKLYKLAVALKVTPEWLSGFNVPMNPKEKRIFRIPVLGTVKAGYPAEAIENILDYEEISEDMALSGEFFALRVNGDSMEPKFSDGDIVIVRKQEDVDNGDIAIMLVNGDEATIKKVQKFEGGINLIPSNSAYDVLTFTNKEIVQLPVQCIGKVVELRAKF